MKRIKIDIECDDELLKAAIGSAICDGLERNGFSNIQVKTLMVYHEVKWNLPGDPVNNFSRESTTSIELNAKPSPGRPPMYMHELIHPLGAFAHPECVIAAVDRFSPDVLRYPILVDPGFEIPSYKKNLGEFLESAPNPHATTASQVDTGNLSVYFQKDAPNIMVEQYIPMFVDQGATDRQIVYVKSLDEVEDLELVKNHTKADNHVRLLIAIDERDGTCYSTLFAECSKPGGPNFFMAVGWINFAKKEDLVAKWPQMQIPVGNNHS